MNENKKFIIFCLFAVFLFHTSYLSGATKKLPYKTDTINGKVFYRYPVEKSIGLYRISIKFGVSQNEIIKYNPSIKESGLRYGETILLIPVSNLEEQNVDNAVVIKKPFSENQTKDIATEKNGKFKMPKVVNVKDEMLDLFKDDTSNIATEDNIDSSVISSPVTRSIGVLLPLLNNNRDISQTTNIFTEFYFGTLLGSKSITSNKYKYELHFFNIGKGVKEIDTLIKNKVLDSLDAILGPVYPEQVSHMTEWVKQHAIPVILPFADNLEDIKTIPYFYQFNMSDKLKIYILLRYLKEHRDSVHCVFIYDENTPTTGIAPALKKKTYSHFISYSEISTTQLLNDSLQYYIEKNKKNIIISNTDKYNSAKVYFPVIKKIAKLFDINIFGEFSWSEFEIGIPLMYCSIFTDEYQLFQNQYDSLYSRYFGQIPENKLLRYDLLGYDLICTIATILDNIPYQPLQSDIKFIRLNEKGCYINKNAKIKVKK